MLKSRDEYTPDIYVISDSRGWTVSVETKKQRFYMVHFDNIWDMENKLHFLKEAYPNSRVIMRKTF